jgi:hypothetical protein
MMGHAAVRVIRKVPLSVWGYVLWKNRRDARRWAQFVSNAIRHPNERSVGALVGEARVRAAITRDVVLRHDPMLTNVKLADGLVTLSSPSNLWRPSQDRIDHLRKVRGVVDVVMQS